jgi:hypothetical protein
MEHTRSCGADVVQPTGTHYLHAGGEAEGQRGGVAN